VKTNPSPVDAKKISRSSVSVWLLYIMNILLHAPGEAGSARVELHSSKQFSSVVREKYDTEAVLKLHHMSVALVMESFWLHGTVSMVSRGEHASPRKEAGDKMARYRLRSPPPKTHEFWHKFHGGALLQD
jgi:hypothetical protein